jgi:hypothetical protein
MSNIKVQIAQKTLELVLANKVIPKKLSYVYVPTKSVIATDKLEELVKQDISCFGCAVGSLLYGAACVFGNVGYNNSVDSKFMIEYLETYGFSFQEIAEIEFFFEEHAFIYGVLQQSFETKEEKEKSKRLIISKEVEERILEHIEKKERNLKEKIVYILEYLIENDGVLPWR